MEGLIFIFCLVCFGHATGFLPLHPIERIGNNLCIKGHRYAGKFMQKMGGCSVCQCHALGLLYLLLSGMLFESPWLYVLLLGLSYVTMFGIGLLGFVLDLLIKIVSWCDEKVS